jgi:hypothetical protein
MGTGNVSNSLDAVVQQCIQKQNRALLDLFNVQRTSIETQGRPLRPIGPSGNTVDAYA